MIKKRYTLRDAINRRESKKIRLKDTSFDQKC